MMMNFEETELRLGLPGGGGNKTTGSDVAAEKSRNGNGKRGFVETTVDLKLKLSSKEMGTVMDLVEDDDDEAAGNNFAKEKPPSKAQVVGWPPVRSFRKNILAVQKKSNSHEESEKVSGNAAAAAAALVKVSMDGAPYLRKVDLKMYKSYQHLSHALSNMLSSFTIGNCESQEMKDFMNESKRMDLLNSSDYVPTYEDRDGDWLLVGDVPWEMFVDSCKRLRIMKGKEAIGLAPRAMEKCKNRS